MGVEGGPSESESGWGKVGDCVGGSPGGVWGEEEDEMRYQVAAFFLSFFLAR